MKIGILTFHNANNYGAVLQAYCLQETLLQMGHDVEIVDYRNRLIEKNTHPFVFSNFWRKPLYYIIQVLNAYLPYRRRAINFQHFRSEYLHLSAHCYRDGKELCDSLYDCLMIGSDQTWNPLITGGIDPVYWGKFAPSHAKVVSYAASSGALKLFDAVLDINSLLKNFSSISVREDRLLNFVEQHSKKATLVLDPTLMADADILSRITTKRIVQEPYVLVYAVESNPLLMEVARKKAKSLKAKLIKASGASVKAWFKYRDVDFINASVPDLLSLIKYAECIVCLSFHGTAFSLVFEKQFLSVQGENIDRVRSVLSRLELEDYIIGDKSTVLPEKKIDYSVVSRKLKSLREQSKQFLLDVLE